MSADLKLGFVIAPGVTQLDFTGALQILNRMPGARNHVIAASFEPTPTDCGFSVVPTTTFVDCPPLDLMLVPGGSPDYIASAVHDDALMAFVAREGARASYVTSVCSGALILGAAGLLKGRRATTHWAFHSELPRVGATPVKARVVRDGNIFTAGGVTAGVDFGLMIAAEIAGPVAAQTLQLINEYDPDPPFDAGHPDRAPEEARAVVAKRMEEAIPRLRDALDRAMARLDA